MSGEEHGHEMQRTHGMETPDLIEAGDAMSNQSGSDGMKCIHSTVTIGKLGFNTTENFMK